MDGSYLCHLMFIVDHREAIEKGQGRAFFTRSNKSLASLHLTTQQIIAKKIKHILRLMIQLWQ